MKNDINTLIRVTLKNERGSLLFYYIVLYRVERWSRTMFITYGLLEDQNAKTEMKRKTECSNE